VNVGCDLGSTSLIRPDSGPAKPRTQSPEPQRGAHSPSNIHLRIRSRWAREATRFSFFRPSRQSHTPRPQYPSSPNEDGCGDAASNSAQPISANDETLNLGGEG